MKIYDISVELHNSLPHWPNEKGFSIHTVQKEGIAVSTIHLGVHVGTHIDAPYHFLSKGKRIGEFGLDRFTGKAKVVTISNPVRIELEDLQKIDLNGCERVLFKTKNSDRRWESEPFKRNYVHLSTPAARFIADQDIKLIGIDYLSIEGFESDRSVHHALLEKDIPILEGLNLNGVPDGEYFLICAPLKIEEAEASPVRALLLTQDIST